MGKIRLPAINHFHHACGEKEHIDWVIKCAVEHSGALPTNIESVLDGLHLYLTKYHKIPLVDLTVELLYSAQVSNSHCCPMHGETNFARNNELPKSYRGYIGSMSIMYDLGKRKHPTKYDMSTLLRACGLHTGTGGGGEVYDKNCPELGKFYRLEYSCKMFFEDFGDSVINWHYTEISNQQREFELDKMQKILKLSGYDQKVAMRSTFTPNIGLTWSKKTDDFARYIAITKNRAQHNHLRKRDRNILG